ncbi:hypothetical protein F53441_5403 [Fusarium austroafricanum]|uniref:Uncharacterized protein n=1 Tax=Fusarium austroafricanum TaxID=2364996 RepID=A0A8H4NUH2_9HYPO|nr:hypothetical protein F53441_5403 [Fusarium austroafricanum]
MSTDQEQVKPEPTVEEAMFDGITPQNTVYVKWDVKGGRDRTHEPYLDTTYSLEGQPNIQGVEIKSSVNVTVFCFADPNPSGNANIEIEGPTGGKHKIDPRRLGSYIVRTR